MSGGPDTGDRTPAATLEAFRAWQGDTFSTETADGPVLVRLERVVAREDLPPRPDGAVPFVLEFVQCGGPVTLPQATWWLAHPGGARVMVFLVPLGPEDGAMRYEAVFN